MPAQPTIAVRESRTDLLEVGPSTGLRGGDYKLIYVIGKGVYRWRTGDQSGNVPMANDSDLWVAPSEDTSGASGAWNLINAEFIDEDDMASDSDTAVPTQQSTAAFVNTFTAGHIDGLELSNGTDADHDIDIATGVCSMRDGSCNRKLFELTSGLTKQIDANWAEGTDAGGFPSGDTLSADTHYNVFLIGKDDGTVDAGFDDTAAATTLLADASNYSWFRRIGSVFTDSSSNILGFTQNGDEFKYNDVSTAEIIDTTVTSGSAETAAISVPANMLAIVRSEGRGNNCQQVDVECQNPTTQEEMVTARLKQSGNNDSKIITTSGYVRVDGSSQVRYFVSVNGSGSESADRFILHSIGWIDDRGRNQ